ncbi:MAG: spore coat protein [Ruminococcaceae bacterium]|nr:spore coat protein [Oscillospiraceae bacterium]
MAQITEKELSAIGDLLTMEQTLQQKCLYMASATNDKVLSNCYTQLAQQHQQHFDELFGNLK